MSQNDRKTNLSPDPSQTTTVAEKDTSVILVKKFYQTNKKGDKLENTKENASIQIVVGTNKFDQGKETRVLVEPISSSAGILINESITPTYIFNPSRKEDGVNLNQVSSPTNDSNLNQQIINETEKGISTVTLFADHIQMVSFLNGVNVYTTPKVLSRLRGLPTISDGAGVSLIHGNSTDTLEPMVLGNKLDKTLLETQERITGLNNDILNIKKDVVALTALLAAHVHITPQIPAGALITAPSIEGIIYSAISVPKQVVDTINSVINEINNIINKINKTSAFKSTFLSDHHKLN